MTTYIALLRAINVGGTGKLAMADLKRLCIAAGFAQVETYIASGNVIFDSALLAQAAQDALAKQLQAHAGKAINVALRTAAELRAVLAQNPFADRDPKRTCVCFLPVRPAADALAGARGRDDEELLLGRREIYLHYPQGMGRSRLRIPAAQQGTVRNLNTVSRLVEISSARGRAVTRRS